jgi:hypothetical protein
MTVGSGTNAQTVKLSPGNSVAVALVGTNGYCITATNSGGDPGAVYYNSTTGGETTTAC